MGGMLCTAARALVHAWEYLKVELHGKYSVERMLHFQSYSETTSVVRAMLWITLTPLPCLLVVIAIDMLPLEPPERGFADNKVFWLRYFLATFTMIFALTQQCHYFVAILLVSVMQKFGVALASSIVGMATIAGFAHRIGFPVPFTVVLVGPIQDFAMVAVMVFMWRKPLRESAEARTRLRRLMMVVVTLAGTVAMYPTFSYGFKLLSGPAQTGFALLLPVMKIAGKNALSALLSHAEDDKSVFVTFHIEVFHSMFVSACLQNSTSIATSLIVTLVDAVEACLSLRDLQLLLDSIHESLDKAARTVDEYAVQGRSGTSGHRDIHDQSVASPA